MEPREDSPLLKFKESQPVSFIRNKAQKIKKKWKTIITNDFDEERKAQLQQGFVQRLKVRTSTIYLRSKS
jgi:hypothetical protein